MNDRPIEAEAASPAALDVVHNHDPSLCDLLGCRDESDRPSPAALDEERLAAAIGTDDECYLTTHAAHHDPQYATVLAARLTEQEERHG